MFQKGGSSPGMGLRRGLRGEMVRGAREIWQCWTCATSRRILNSGSEIGQLESELVVEGHAWCLVCVREDVLIGSLEPGPTLYKATGLLRLRLHALTSCPVVLGITRPTSIPLKKDLREATVQAYRRTLSLYHLWSTRGHLCLRGRMEETCCCRKSKDVCE